MWADPHTGTETHDNICAIMVPYPLFTCAHTHTREMRGRGKTEVFFLLTGERLPAQRAGEMYLIRQLWSHQLNREKKTLYHHFFFWYPSNSNHKACNLYSTAEKIWNCITSDTGRSHQCISVCVVSSSCSVPALLSPQGCSAAAQVALLRGGKKTVRSLTNQSQSNVLCSLHVRCQGKAHFLRRCFTLNALRWRNRFNVKSHRQFVWETVSNFKQQQGYNEML